MVSSTQVQGRQVLEMKFSCSDCFHLCIGRKTKKARKMSILTYLRTVDSLILEYFMIFHCVFFLVQYGPMLDLKKPISTSHEPGIGSSHAPKSERGALVNWVGHGSLWRHCGNGETTELLYCLLFKHVSPCLLFCQCLPVGLKHVETNDLSHKVTRQICGMGKKTSRGLQIIIC